MSESPSILSRLEASRRELLDLTFRNRLLNFTELKARGARIVDERSAEILRILVAEQKTMTFAPAPETPPGPEVAAEDGDPVEQFLAIHPEAQARPEEEEDGPAERHRDRVLQTPYPEERLERRLLNTDQAARESIQEHGVNTLFLSLGMLRYADPAQAGRTFAAPLLLIPVELNRANVRSQFQVRHNGEDVGGNVSLQAKLRNDLGVDWPAFEEPESWEAFDLAAFFARCEAVASARPGWSVARDEIHLGFFTFHKFVMWKDLDPALWPEEGGLDGHPVLAPLLGEEGFAPEPPALPAEGPLDDLVPPDRAFHVLDADSSQVATLAEISAGRNLVVEGPPGTGKSQTITNLIAQAVAEGKSVLFVAEKMAALDVVRRRLDQIGLAPIALELHSNRSSKAAVLKDIQAGLGYAAPGLEGYEAHLRELTGAMDDLTRHADLVNLPVRESGRPLIRLMGRYLRLREELNGTGPPDLDVAGWDDWTPEQAGAAFHLAGRLELLLRESGPLRAHPFRDVRVTALLPHEPEEIGVRAASAAEAAADLAAALTPLAAALGFRRPLSAQEAATLAELLEAMRSWPDLTGLPAANRAWVSEAEGLEAEIARVARIQETRRTWTDELADAAWTDSDAKALAACLAEYRGRAFRWLSGRYRAAARKAAAHWRIRPPRSLARRIEALEAVVQVQDDRAALEANGEELATLFGPYWKREESDPERLREVARCLYALHRCGLAEDLIRSVADALTGGLATARFTEEISRLRATCDALERRLAPVLGTLEVTAQRFTPESGFRDYPLPDMTALLEAWRDRPLDVHPVARLNALEAEAQTAGLAALFEAAATWDEAATHLEQLIEYRWSARLIRILHEAHPELARFSAALAGRRVGEFRSEDCRHLLYNRARVLEAHAARRPSRHGAGEMGVLSREFNKKTRHLPVRRLLTEAGLAVRRIKPVFLMSPFSVATYLPRRTDLFDLVVFDEASQVRPVDALGALARGRQAVVVGDTRQLPPTLFFDRLDEGGDDDESPTQDIESILHQMKARGAAESMLRWHYRSRHHSLIAYSNRGFYGDRLVLFPSPELTCEARGLRLVHLPDGVYEPGASRRRNPVEARQVAEAVLRHARETPRLSLGVAAFNLSQMQLLLDEVEILRRQNPDTDAFFAAHPDEPFFVKNLENIQGDERDVIFISVGYGRDALGNLSMNFGPLNQEGGERRLNVLITRAKQRCVVFSNFTADDLDLSRTQAAGVRHLRGYLAYAASGRLDLPRASGREPDSPFETEVAAAIRTLGMEVDHQVGTAGYFVDLGVRDPARPGRYLLGVECDGAMYHSGRTARERDRIRQAQLESLGWRIHRIWSTSWFENPEAELRKVRAALDAAPATPEDTPPPPPPAPLAEAVETDPGEAEDPPTTPPYRMGRIRGGQGVRTAEQLTEARLRRWILEVVEAEAPVHADEIVVRIRDGTPISRAGTQVRRRIEETLAALAQERAIHLDGPFAWADAERNVEPRDRSEASGVSNQLDHIAPEELRAAAVQAARDACRIGPEDLGREILRLLGLGSLTAQRREWLERAIEGWVEDRALREQDGGLVAGEGGRGERGK